MTTTDLANIRRQFLYDSLSEHIKTEDDAIEFLRGLLRAIGARILDYRSNKDGRFHSSEERGKDLLIRFNSFANTSIAIQAKRVRGNSLEISITQMGQILNQVQEAAVRTYLLDSERLKPTKACLAVFGGVSQSAREYFIDFTERLGLSLELWTTDTIIERTVNHPRWDRIIENLGWKSNFEVWYQLCRADVIGQLSIEKGANAGQHNFVHNGKRLRIRLEPLPKTGLFLSSFTENQTLNYRGYSLQLSKLYTGLHQNALRVSGSGTEQSVASVLYKVVGRSGLGKSSFLRAGLVKEFILSKEKVSFLPVVLECSPYWKSLASLRENILNQLSATFGADHPTLPASAPEGAFVLVLDQFENLLRSNQDAVSILWKLLQEVSALDWSIVLGLRDDYLYETKLLLQQMPETIEMKIAKDEIMISGLVANDAEEFLAQFDNAVVRKNIGRIVAYLTAKSRLGTWVDPARLQIILHFLATVGSESQDMDYLQADLLANLETVYISAILNRFPEDRFAMLRILLRWGVKRNESNRFVSNHFSLHEVAEKISLRREEIATILEKLTDVRLIVRESDKSRTHYRLTHDRLAEHLVAAYRSLYQELEVISEIDEFVLALEDGALLPFPDHGRLKGWSGRLASISREETQEGLDRKGLFFTTLLFFVASIDDRTMPCEYDDDLEDWKNELNTFIAGVEDLEWLLRIPQFFGHALTPWLVEQYLAQAEKILSEKGRSQEFFKLEIRAVLAALAEYLGKWTERLREQLVLVWSDSDERAKQSLARSLRASAGNSYNLARFLRDEDSKYAEIAVRMLRHCRINESAARVLLEALQAPKLAWICLETLSQRLIAAHVCSDPDALEYLQAEFSSTIVSRYEEFNDRLVMREAASDNRLRELYYLIKCLAFMPSTHNSDLLELALHHSDFRIRRISGAAYIRKSSSDDLARLLNRMLREGTPDIPRRGGSGGAAYRLRQTIYEMLQLVWDPELGVSNEVKLGYAASLRDVVSEELLRLEELAQDGNFDNSEVRDPDRFDEDRATLLVLLLGSIPIWSNLDLFIKCLEEPISLIGAFDIPEAAVVALMKICETADARLNEKDLEKLKNVLVENCFSHTHNGVSGRSVKLFRWLGSSSDLEMLGKLESHTIKNLRENSLLSREAILERLGDGWGSFLDSDGIARLWN